MHSRLVRDAYTEIPENADVDFPIRAAGSILHAFIQPTYRGHARVPLITGDRVIQLRN